MSEFHITLTSADSQWKRAITLVAVELFQGVLNSNKMDITCSDARTVYQKLTRSILFNNSSLEIISNRLISNEFVLSIPKDLALSFECFLKLAGENISNKMSTPKHLLESGSEEFGPNQVSTCMWAVSKPKRLVVIGNGFTAAISGDSIAFTIDLTWPGIVTGRSSEEVGIECEILYPDGSTTLYPIWQMDRLVKHTKHELFMEGGLQDFPEEELYLEIELPDEETQVMDDNQILGFYMEDLTRAIRIHMKVIPQHIVGFVIKQQIAFSTGAVNS